MSAYESAFESYENEGPNHESYESYENEWEQPEVHESESYESGYETESYESQESQETELAQELLEITSEEELEQFLGGLVRGASRFLKSGVGRAVTGVLKTVAQKGLPILGSALGSVVAPGIGTAIGGKLGSMAAGLLEVGELESMGEAEAELEAARRYVRWARGTVRTAMRAPAGTPPRTIARAAAVSSARRYAPALLRSGQRGQGRGRSQSVRTSPWRRRRGPGWGSPTYAFGTRPRCTCGARRWDVDEPSDNDWDTDADRGQDNWQDKGPDNDQESYEAFESQETGPQSAQSSSAQSSSTRSGAHHPGGRWYRRGDRIVIVGA